jgi:hypothetical protein
MVVRKHVMALELLISFLMGATFGGIGFKVMSVVPAALTAMLLALMAGVAHADHFWFIVTTMILLGTAVQIGYLAGILIRVGFMSLHRH